VRFLLDEETALSIIFTNTKRKSRTLDLVSIAESFAFLQKLYGSQKEVAKRVGLSSEMVREFLSINKLPEEVRKLIANRTIDSIDVVKQLASIREPEQQISLAKQLGSLNSEEIRDVRRMVKVGGSSTEDAIKEIMSTREEPLNVFVLDLNEDIYQLLATAARKRKMQPADLAKEILVDWLRGTKVK